MSDTDVSSGVFDVTIPIRFEADDAQLPSPAASIEKQMDREVEQVFREWDENVVSRQQSTFRVRPTSTSSSTGDKRRRRTAASGSGLRRSLGGTPSGTSRFEFPEIDLIRRDDVILNSSADSADEDGRRQFYVDSPLTGSRMFRMEFDVSGYDQENVSVKVSGMRLIVHAVQHESDSGRKSTTEFCRKVKLPPDVNVSRLQCTCSNGRLVVEAPTAGSSGSTSGTRTPTFPVSSPKVEPLNKPVFRNATSGNRTLSLTVELGRIFRADDVVVKVRSHDKLVIHAERQEQSAGSRMKASITREFDLEEKITPQSLNAGLTAEGLLKITAQVAAIQVEVITNGLGNGDTGNDKSNT